MVLPPDHRWRLNARSFDSKLELGVAPAMLGGNEILRQLHELVCVHEDTRRKKRKEKCNRVREQIKKWYKRRKIFSSYCSIGHEIKKTKDNHVTLLDLRKMGLRPIFYILLMKITIKPKL
jgi:hypothetical protein